MFNKPFLSTMPSPFPSAQQLARRSRQWLQEACRVRGLSPPYTTSASLCQALVEHFDAVVANPDSVSKTVLVEDMRLLPLTVTGSKHVLVRRLATYCASFASAAVSTSATAPSASSSASDQTQPRFPTKAQLEGRGKAWLREACRVRGLPADGTIAVLSQALVDHFDAVVANPMGSTKAALKADLQLIGTVVSGSKHVLAQRLTTMLGPSTSGTTATTTTTTTTTSAPPKHRGKRARDDGVTSGGGGGGAGGGAGAGAASVNKSKKQKKKRQRVKSASVTTGAASMPSTELCRPVDIPTPTTKKPLEGIAVCVTGRLPAPRKHYEQMFRNQGATVCGSVAAAVTHVVIGGAPGASKLAAIKKRGRGVKTMSYSEFDDLRLQRLGLLGAGSGAHASTGKAPQQLPKGRKGAPKSVQVVAHDGQATPLVLTKRNVYPEWNPATHEASLVRLSASLPMPFTLPPSYLHFIRRYNGGVPRYRAVKGVDDRPGVGYQSGDGPEMLYGVTYHSRWGWPYDLESSWRGHRNQFPANQLPIGMDAGGNVFTICMEEWQEEEEVGAVYFCDPHAGGSRRRLATSFSDFLQRFKTAEDVEAEHEAGRAAAVAAVAEHNPAVLQRYADKLGEGFVELFKAALCDLVAVSGKPVASKNDDGLVAPELFFIRPHEARAEAAVAAGGTIALLACPDVRIVLLALAARLAQGLKAGAEGVATSLQQLCDVDLPRPCPGVVSFFIKRDRVKAILALLQQHKIVAQRAKQFSMHAQFVPQWSA